MVKFIRVLTVIAALWSALGAGFLWLVGAAFSMTDRFNGPHTAVMAVIGFLEAALLFALYGAYRLQTWAVLVLMAWFAVAGALATRPFTLSAWPGHCVLLLAVMMPVTLVMVLLAFHWSDSRRQKP